MFNLPIVKQQALRINVMRANLYACKYESKTDPGCELRAPPRNYDLGGFKLIYYIRNCKT